MLQITGDTKPFAKCSRCGYVSRIESREYPRPVLARCLRLAKTPGVAAGAAARPAFPVSVRRHQSRTRQPSPTRTRVRRGATRLPSYPSPATHEFQTIENLRHGCRDYASKITVMMVPCLFARTWGSYSPASWNAVFGRCPDLGTPTNLLARIGRFLGGGFERGHTLDGPGICRGQDNRELWSMVDFLANFW